MFKITLEAARVNAGLSQKEAAKLLKISNSTLGNWENGKSLPNAEQIVELCKLYGCPYDIINFFAHRYG